MAAVRIIALTDEVPQFNETVHVWDGGVRRWYYEATYKGRYKDGRHRFVAGFDGYGDLVVVDHPTHFCRFTLPNPEET